MNARFLPAGDCAVMVELEEVIGPVLNRRLRALEWLIGEGRLPGVLETVPSFRALLVYYEPAVIDFDTLRSEIEARVARAGEIDLPAARSIEIPCCYRDPALSFDLEAVAGRLGLSVDALIQLHTGAEYLVYFIGFAPGQPYLTGLPPQLEIPRLESPRTRTPAGSVGIGGTQGCIYSVESPGGFWVLGRTPLPLYDPDAPEPILLRPGDRLRFVSIDAAEYARIAARVAQRSFTPRIT